MCEEVWSTFCLTIIGRFLWINLVKHFPFVILTLKKGRAKASPTLVIEYSCTLAHANPLFNICGCVTISSPFWSRRRLLIAKTYNSCFTLVVSLHMLSSGTGKAFTNLISALCLLSLSLRLVRSDTWHHGKKILLVVLPLPNPEIICFQSEIITRRCTPSQALRLRSIIKNMEWKRCTLAW